MGTWTGGIKRLTVVGQDTFALQLFMVRRASCSEKSILRYCFCVVESVIWFCTHLFRSVFSVGCGLGGKLGQGSRADEKQPKEITHFRMLNFQPAAVAAGAWHAAARAMDGRVATWGWGRHGCLGHGTDQCENVPRVVQGLEGVRAVHVAAGDYTTFVVGGDGDVWSFGSAESSCLGHGVTEPGAEGEEGEEAEVEFHVSLDTTDLLVFVLISVIHVLVLSCLSE